MTRKKTSADIESRRSKAVQDATPVFLRYGYARTTMADLAVACRMSRPALYELFPGKEEVFAEVIRALNRNAIDAYRQQTGKLKSLRSRLQRFCRDWGTHGLRLAEQHPDSKDLFDLDRPVVREMFQEFIDFLITLVLPESGLGEAQTKKLIFNLVYSLLGLATVAKDVSDMEQMTDLQIDLILLALEQLPT